MLLLLEPSDCELQLVTSVLAKDPGGPWGPCGPGRPRGPTEPEDPV